MTEARALRLSSGQLVPPDVRVLLVVAAILVPRKTAGPLAYRVAGRSLTALAVFVFCAVVLLWILGVLGNL